MGVYISFKIEFDNKKEIKQEICNWNIKNQKGKQNTSVFWKWIWKKENVKENKNEPLFGNTSSNLSFANSFLLIIRNKDWDSWATMHLYS